MENGCFYRVIIQPSLYVMTTYQLLVVTVQGAVIRYVGSVVNVSRRHSRATTATTVQLLSTCQRITL